MSERYDTDKMKQPLAQEALKHVQSENSRDKLQSGNGSVDDWQSLAEAHRKAKADHEVIAMKHEAMAEAAKWSKIHMMVDGVHRASCSLTAEAMIRKYLESVQRYLDCIQWRIDGRRRLPEDQDWKEEKRLQDAMQDNASALWYLLDRRIKDE